MTLRTYSDVSRSELGTFAGSRGGGYAAADALYGPVDGGLGSSLTGRLTDAGVDALGYEFAVGPPSGSGAFSGLSGTITLGVVWLLPGSGGGSTTRYLAARDTRSGPSAVESSPPASAGQTSNWTAEGTLFVGHYSGSDADVTATSWKDAFGAASLDAGDEGRPLVGVEAMGRPVGGSTPRLLAGSGDAWYAFGAELSVTDAGGSLAVAYENGRYRNLAWLLAELGLATGGGGTSSGQGPPPHPFVEGAHHRIPDWSPAKSRSGTFQV